ncbi:MAG: FtsX-like permease family protein [Deltaproteobacteria bacterium]
MGGCEVPSESQTTVVFNGRNDLVHSIAITPDFFTTLRVPVVRGRDFTAADQSMPPRVAVVNEAFARRYIRQVDPVGERLMTGIGPEKVEVIGVVQDTKYDSVLAEAPPIIYMPLRPKFIPNFRVIEVRVAGDSVAAAATIQKIVRGVDPTLPADVRLLTDFISQSLIIQGLVARVSGFFAALALLLACLGLYGLISLFVSQRTREVGIRIALGAESVNVLWLIMRGVCTLMLAGSAIGILISLAAGSLLGAQLFGLKSNDPITLGGSVALLWIVATIAAYIPARRATKVDPMVALRYE